MSGSIVTNTAAYYAQQNLKSAGAMAQASIARLSSGQRIVRASDDVAALSIGTILQSNVATLKTALTNTQQASSLLQVADGGLKNIATILQKQKSLAVQANSGTLSDTERSYLNQAFQSLTSEIDRLVENTKFNQVVLLDGSLSKAVSATFNVNDSTTLLNAGTTCALYGAPTTGQTMLVNGVTITFTSSTFGTADAAGKVVIGGTFTDTVSNLVSFLNNSNDARLSAFQFVQSATNTFSINWGGGNINAGTTISVSAGTFTIITAVNGGFTAHTDADGLAAGRIRASGSITGTLLRPFGNSSAGVITSDGGIDVQGIYNNEAFVGSIGEGSFGRFNVQFAAASTVDMSITVGGITYVANNVLITQPATTDFIATFTGYNDTTAAGGSFILRLQGGSVSAIASQTDADTVENRLNDALAGITFSQNRDVTGVNFTNTVLTDGVETANLNRMRADLLSSDFGDVQIEDVRVTAPGFGTTDAKIELTINGERYTTYSGLGKQISTKSLIAFGNVDDPSKAFYLVTGSTAVAGVSGVAVRIETDAQAQSLETALLSAFGVDDGHAKLSFQTGNTSTDSIGIEIKSASTTNLYDGLSLSVATAVDAIAASDQLDIAISAVIKLRADVGALQSRFDFAGANLEASIQNQDAARGTFQDTDVSTESTAFAQAQVLTQASISVLAQANLLPQNLLKLIG